MNTDNNSIIKKLICEELSIADNCNNIDSMYSNLYNEAVDILTNNYTQIPQIVKTVAELIYIASEREQDAYVNQLYGEIEKNAVHIHDNQLLETIIYTSKAYKNYITLSIIRENIKRNITPQNIKIIIQHIPTLLTHRNIRKYLIHLSKIASYRLIRKINRIVRKAKKDIGKTTTYDPMTENTILNDNAIKEAREYKERATELMRKIEPLFI
jgi:hypothetical protein